MTRSGFQRRTGLFFGGFVVWFRLEVGFFDNPKIVAVPNDAKLLYIRGLDYCMGYLTDGFIPASMLPRLGASCGVKRPTAHANMLVTTGLWDLADDGWQVHDYLEHQPSKEQRERQQASWRKATAKHRGSPGHRMTPAMTPAMTPPMSHTNREDKSTYIPSTGYRDAVTSRADGDENGKEPEPTFFTEKERLVIDHVAEHIGWPKTRIWAVEAAWVMGREYLDHTVLEDCLLRCKDAAGPQYLVSAVRREAATHGIEIPPPSPRRVLANGDGA